MGIADKIKEIFHHDSAEKTTSSTSNTHTKDTHPGHAVPGREAIGTDDRTMNDERDTVTAKLPGSVAVSHDVLSAGVHNGVTGVGSKGPLDRNDSNLNRDHTYYEPKNPIPHNEPGGAIGEVETMGDSSVETRR